jgi:sugar transferase (PEP-CTERM/EpsH1 system associated)
VAHYTRKLPTRRADGTSDNLEKRRTLMRQPPLILHVIHHLLMGGMENGLVNLINRIPPGRYRHGILCMEDISNFRDRIERDDVPILAMKKSELTTLQLYLRVLRVIKELGPAIVHTRNLSGLDALPPAWIAGVPYRIHGEHGFDVQDAEARNLRRRLLRRLHRPLVHRYVAVSKDLQRYLTRQVGVSPARVTQIYNGVDTERFTAADSPPAGLMPKTFYGEGKVVFGTAGRLEPIKDQATLVRAFAQVLREEPMLRSVARLVVVGDGPLRESLAACVREEQVGDVTWLAGARDDMAQVYQCLDVFILTSLREGISNTLLEAMSSALPVIATEVGGNGEVVAPGVNGRLIPTADPKALAVAMKAYLGDAELRSRHAKASRERAVSSFGIDAMVRNYLRLYETARAAPT